MSVLRVHPAAWPVRELLEQCQVLKGRSGGPGGQNRNKVETAIELVHKPTGVRVEAEERRSQGENLGRAIFRLRVALALACRAAVARPHEPSEAWSKRTRGGCFACNPEHDDFPAVLAEALDVLQSVEWDPRRAGILLGVSMSQLVKFLRSEPKALEWLNARRQVAGLRRLK